MPGLIATKVVYNITKEQNYVASLVFVCQDSSPPCRRMGMNLDTQLNPNLESIKVRYREAELLLGR